ncbi:hypothetical protein DFH27DRAFT_127355 [Peziza echinospora]|nr:hypothetical protein DFH27DRAFT_127355 [Peziza echinospora]
MATVIPQAYAYNASDLPGQGNGRSQGTPGGTRSNSVPPQSTAGPAPPQVPRQVPKPPYVQNEEESAPWSQSHQSSHVHGTGMPTGASPRPQTQRQTPLNENANPQQEYADEKPQYLYDEKSGPSNTMDQQNSRYHTGHNNYNQLQSHGQLQQLYTPISISLGDYNTSQIDRLTIPQLKELDRVLAFLLDQFTTKQKLTYLEFKSRCEMVESLLAQNGLKRNKPWIHFFGNVDEIMHVKNDVERVEMLSHFAYGMFNTDNKWRDMGRVLMSLAMVAEYRGLKPKRGAQMTESVLY